MKLENWLENTVSRTRRLTISEVHTCRFCNKEFAKEKTLAIHMCEQKRRYLQKDELRVQNGFYVYDRFYKLTQNNKSNKTYEDFCRSSYYNAFVKFGSFLTNVNPLYPDRYIDWIIKSGVPLDKWCREELYDKYVVDLIKTESLESASERTINTMCEWSEKNSAVWNHYFLYAKLDRVTYDIRDGKISPWILLNCDSGLTVLKKMTDEQLAIIGPMIDVMFWTDKFKRNPTDTIFVKKLVQEANL